MNSAYADTSLIASMLLPGRRRALAAAAATEAGGPLPLTAFARMELTNVLRLAVFRGEVVRGAIEAVEAVLAAQELRGLFTAVDFPAGALERAGELVRRHTLTTGARALDILHVASALELDARLFLTFDRRQADLARAAGLLVGPV